MLTYLSYIYQYTQLQVDFLLRASQSLKSSLIHEKFDHALFSHWFSFTEWLEARKEYYYVNNNKKLAKKYSVYFYYSIITLKGVSLTHNKL